MTVTEASYVPRESEDQLQARLPGTNGTQRTGLHDLIVSATHPVREALVRTGDLGCSGGPSRRPWEKDKPLPTNHSLVSRMGWGRP